jgi:glutathione S-transferase
MSKLKVYGVPQSRAARTLWMVEECGVPYERVQRVSPKTRIRRVPGDQPEPAHTAIDDDGVIVWESMAINLYLAKKYGGDLAPKNLAEEAHATQWSFWVMTEVEKPLLNALFARTGMMGMTKDEAVATKYFDEIRKPLDVLNGHLSKHDYVLGNRFYRGRPERRVRAELGDGRPLQPGGVAEGRSVAWQVRGAPGGAESARDSVVLLLTTLRWCDRCRRRSPAQGQCGHRRECRAERPDLRDSTDIEQKHGFARMLRHLRERRHRRARCLRSAAAIASAAALPRRRSTRNTCRSRLRGANLSPPCWRRVPACPRKKYHRGRPQRARRQSVRRFHADRAHRITTRRSRRWRRGERVRLGQNGPMYSSSTPYAVTRLANIATVTQHRAIAAHFLQTGDERIDDACVRAVNRIAAVRR